MWDLITGTELGLLPPLAQETLSPFLVFWHHGTSGVAPQVTVITLNPYVRGWLVAEGHGTNIIIVVGVVPQNPVLNVLSEPWYVPLLHQLWWNTENGFCKLKHNADILDLELKHLKTCYWKITFFLLIDKPERNYLYFLAISILCSTCNFLSYTCILWITWSRHIKSKT